MTARVLTIKERDRQSVGMLASLADFTFVEREEVNPRVVIDNPDISLYCLDDESKRAVFVQLPPGVDLPKAPSSIRRSTTRPSGSSLCRTRPSLS